MPLAPPRPSASPTPRGTSLAAPPSVATRPGSLLSSRFRPDYNVISPADEARNIACPRLVRPVRPGASGPSWRHPGSPAPPRHNLVGDARRHDREQPAGTAKNMQKHKGNSSSCDLETGKKCGGGGIEGGTGSRTRCTAPTACGAAAQLHRRQGFTSQLAATNGAREPIGPVRSK